MGIIAGVRLSICDRSLEANAMRGGGDGVLHFTGHGTAASFVGDFPSLQSLGCSSAAWSSLVC